MDINDITNEEAYKILVYLNLLDRCIGFKFDSVFGEITGYNKYTDIIFTLESKAREYTMFKYRQNMVQHLEKHMFGEGE